MTLPPHFVTLDLSGRFILNSSMSDCYEDMLQEQGLDDSKLRCAVTGGVLSLNHYEDENGSQRIWVQQELAGCSRIADDHRILDWHDRARNDALFGAVVEKMRRIKTPCLQPPFLRAGWTPDTLKFGVLQYHVSTDSDTTRNHHGRKWTVVETWGIEAAEGERRFARHIRLTGPGGLEMERRLVYDYIGAI